VVDQLRRGAERVGDRVDAARQAMGDRVDAAREVVGEKAGATRDAAADAIGAVKPRLRGVSHQWAFFVSLFLGAGLILAADSGRATLAATIYAASLSALFGTSALYHRVNWRRPELRRWMRRLDHSMIFLLIAGTYTPFALLVLHGALADAILAVVWAGALAGTIVEMIWIEAPKWVTAGIYLSLGWVAVVAFPELWHELGVGGTALIATGGLLYTVGAVVYATQRPNPNPAVFGYHEVFHLLVIGAAAAQFAAVAFYALPAG
jgi:hemolysin III